VDRLDFGDDLEPGLSSQHHGRTLLCGEWQKITMYRVCEPAARSVFGTEDASAASV